MIEKKTIAKLNFIDGANKKKSMTIPNPVAEFNADLAQKAMDEIIEANAFEVEGIAKYVTKDRAETIETVRKTIYSAKKV